MPRILQKLGINNELLTEVKNSFFENKRLVRERKVTFSCRSITLFIYAITNCRFIFAAQPAKLSQHVTQTYRNIVGRNIVGRNMLCTFSRPVATCCVMLEIVGSNLTTFKLEPKTSNMLQQGVQTNTTCCDMFR